MTKTIKGFIKTFNKHELGKEYSKTNSYLADGILFELKDVYNAGTNDSVIYPYIYEVEAKIEDVWNIAKKPNLDARLFPNYKSCCCS